MPVSGSGQSARSRRPARRCASIDDRQHGDAGRLRVASRIEVLPQRRRRGPGRRRARSSGAAAGRRGRCTVTVARRRRRVGSIGARRAAAATKPRSTSTVRAVVQRERRDDVEADAARVHAVVDQELALARRIAGARHTAKAPRVPVGDAGGSATAGASRPLRRASAAAPPSRASAGAASCRRRCKATGTSATVGDHAAASAHGTAAARPSTSSGARCTVVVGRRCHARWRRRRECYTGPGPARSP